MTKDGMHITVIETGKQQGLFKAFRFAWRGLQQFFLNDRNGRIHLGAALGTVLAGFTLHVSRIEWLFLLLCIGLVIALEMINAAIEKFCDMVHNDFHPAIKIIKDMCAGAVLWVSLISAVTGAVIFIPKIIALL